MEEKHEGSCLCGAVRYTVVGPLSDVVACHCSQCRKQTGHHYATINVADTSLTVEGDESIVWYNASPDARRGFCGTCGSALFWKHRNEVSTALLAGSLDGDTGRKLSKHIYCTDKGDYYDIPPDMPQTP